MSVTVATIIYGNGYEHYLSGWIDASIAAQPDAIIVSTDQDRCDAQNVICTVSQPPSDWRFAGSWFLNKAFERATTDWVWVVGVDDRIRPQALQALIGREHCDVVQVGYRRSDGFTYRPPPIKNRQILALKNNALFACSPIKRDAWLRVGGFPDVAFEDWAMWRKLARADCTFGYSFNVAVDYDWHPETNATMRFGSTPENALEALAY
jgi:glycosyltransferase involved in cell wall biosynthesis